MNSPSTENDWNYLFMGEKNPMCIYIFGTVIVIRSNLGACVWLTMRFQAYSLWEKWYSLIHANWWASWQPANEIQTSIHASLCVWGFPVCVCECACVYLCVCMHVCGVCNSVWWRPVNCLIDLSTLHKGRVLCPPPSGCYSLPSPFSLILLFHSPLCLCLCSHCPSAFLSLFTHFFWHVLLTVVWHYWSNPEFN